MRKIFSISFIVITFFITGCRREGKGGIDIVAQVNSAKMTKAELDAAIPENSSDEIKLLLKREMVEKWIEDEIFYQSALDEGITLTEPEKKLVFDYEKQLIIQKYLNRKINIDYHILDRDIDDYYNKHKEEFKWDDDYVHIIHLIMENKDNAIITEINKSKDLLDIIRKDFFDLQSKSERPIGDLGYIKISDLPPQIATAIKFMKTGDINHNPIKTEYGYHFIQLIDYKRAGEFKNINVIKNDILLRLKLEKRNLEMEKLKQKLRENYNIMTDLSKFSQ